jgi:hypothetical protein
MVIRAVSQCNHAYSGIRQLCFSGYAQLIYWISRPFWFDSHHNTFTRILQTYQFPNPDAPVGEQYNSGRNMVVNTTAREALILLGLRHKSYKPLAPCHPRKE